MVERLENETIIVVSNLIFAHELGAVGRPEYSFGHGVENFVKTHSSCGRKMILI